MILGLLLECLSSLKDVRNKEKKSILMLSWNFVGAVCGPADIVDQMRDLHGGPLMLLGPTMNPKLAFEISG